MTWETVWNISKLFALVLGGAAVITLIVKVYSSASKDKIIDLLEKQVEDASRRVTSYEGDAERYRQKASSVEADLHFARGKLKEVETENARLLAKTDLSPVMNGLKTMISLHEKATKEQTAINEKVLEALQKLLDHPVINGNGFPK